MNKKITFFSLFVVLFAPLTALAMVNVSNQEQSQTGSAKESPEIKTQVVVDLSENSVTNSESEETNIEKTQIDPTKPTNNDGLVRMQVQAENQEQRQIHETGTGLENPELKEMNQEQNQMQINKNNVSSTEKKFGRSLERRSEVANAVQEMLQVAERNGGIGEQIREIAQNQNQLQNNIENSLEKVQNQNKFIRFLIGPKYNEIDGVKINLENHLQKIEELKTLANEVSGDDKVLLENQIEKMEQVTTEIKSEIQNEENSFSLFGWLKRLF
ncbi:MAG: hypothetical protein WC414_00535 [Patescibacteria group bacterium]